MVVPIIIVSVRDSDRDKVEALDAGADDFVSKPFSIDELMARIRAALRRTGFATDTTPKHISLPGLEVDFDRELRPGFTVADAIQGREAAFEPVASGTAE